MTNELKYEYYGFPHWDADSGSEPKIISHIDGQEYENVEIAVKVSLHPKKQPKTGEPASEFGDIEVADWAANFSRVVFLVTHLEAIRQEGAQTSYMPSIARS